MEFPARRRCASFALCLVIALFISATDCTRSENAEDGVVYRPTFEQCQDRLSEIGRTAGQSNVGWHISSLCSAVTMWWPGNEKRCCSTMFNYVGGEGGALENCLCDPDTADSVVSSFGWLVDVGALNEKCEKYDIVIPYKDNAVCPPPDPNAPTAKEDAEDASTPPQKEEDAPVEGLIPSQGDCISMAEEIGEGELVRSFAGCFFGATNGCCSSAVKLVGKEGGLAHCLCDPESASFISDQAKSYGMNVDDIMNGCVKKDYEVPFNFNEFCPSSSSSQQSPSPSSKPPSPSPALIPDPSPPQKESPDPAPEQEQPPTTPKEPSAPALQDQQQKPLPTLDECVSKAEAVGQAAIVRKVIPCLAGGGLECCNAALELVGPGGDLELCLCSEESASFITDETEKLGFDLKGILSKCVDELNVELPFFGNKYCGGGSEAPLIPDPEEEQQRKEEKTEEMEKPVVEQKPPAPGSADRTVVEVIGLPPGVTTLPSTVECGKAGSEIGESQIIAAMMPCLDQPSEACCAAAENLIGPDGALAFCGCNQELMGAIEALAADLGLTPQQIQSYVSACPQVPLLPAGNCPAAPERGSNLLGPASSEKRPEGPAAVGELAAPGDDLLESTAGAPSNSIQPTEDPGSAGSGGSGIPSWVWGAVFAAAGVGIVLVGLTIYVYGFGQVPVSPKKSKKGNKAGAPQEAIASTQAAVPAAGPTGDLSGVSSNV